MRPFASFLFSAFALLAPLGAQAGSIVKCDFFQDQLIGAFCEQSYGAGATFTRNQVLQNVDSFVGETSQSNSFVGALNAYVAPFSWLKLSLGSQYDVANYSDYVAATNNKFTTHSSGFGEQSIQAALRLYEYRAEDLRIFVTGTGTMGVLPGIGANSTTNMLAGAGLQAGASWRLGQSGFSLNPYASMNLSHISGAEQTSFGSSFRLLLSQDAWGVAAGPVVAASAQSQLAGGAGAYKDQTYVFGAHVTAAPFRFWDAPVLKDTVFNFEAVHSLARPLYTSIWVSNADDMRYTGSLQFNFTY